MSLGYGDAFVQAYIVAVPGWKRDACRWIDAAVTATVPGVLKAVKWNSPLYGMAEGEYFLSYHCFDRHVKVAFHNGAQLDPPPPVASKQPKVCYPHVRGRQRTRRPLHRLGEAGEQAAGEKM